MRNRLTSGLLLAVYALSATAASSFHDHAHRGGPCCSQAEHACGELADHLHAHDANACCANRGNTFAESSEPSTDDSCVVCRFLGLSSLPTVVPPLPASPELVADVNPVEPRYAALPLTLTLHSRAPPQLV